MKLNFFSDPGHGWLRVKVSDLIDLGISMEISGYSYRNGDWAYLEEDCDAPIFLDAYKEKHGNRPDIEVIYSNSSSSIRRYSRYPAVLVGAEA